MRNSVECKVWKTNTGTSRRNHRLGAKTRHGRRNPPSGQICGKRAFAKKRERRSGTNLRRIIRASTYQFRERNRGTVLVKTE